MSRKIVSVFICFLFISMIPIAAGLNNDIVEKRGLEPIDRKIYLVFGFFPETINESIYYWVIPLFIKSQISVDELRLGFNCRFFIIGISRSKPYYYRPTLIQPCTII